jgi:hypothetical protein
MGLSSICFQDWSAGPRVRLIRFQIIGKSSCLAPAPFSQQGHHVSTTAFLKGGGFVEEKQRRQPTFAPRDPSHRDRDVRTDDQPAGLHRTKGSSLLES